MSKANLVTPRTLAGFMELLPRDQLIFERIRAALEETYALYGFYPLDTPVLEHAEILFAKAGGETEKQVYRFMKGDTDLAMRFDLTVPLAKYVAKNAGELSFPFRRYQIGKVYRGERAQKGRFREFYQSDIDIIGDGELGLANDAEIPAIIDTLLRKLGLDEFVIRINNRKILSGFFTLLGLGDQIENVLRTVDKIDKIGADKVREELTDTFAVPAEAAARITDFIALKGSNAEIIAALREMAGEDELFNLGIDELETVCAGILAFGVPEDHFRIDLSIARGLDYYTGTVYETTLLRHPEIGSVCSGGRYDNLAGFYTERRLPGVGMSIGLTRLFYILNEMDELGRAMDAPADVLVIPMTDDMTPAIAVAAQLRKEGIRTQIYMEKKKFKVKIGYADKLHMPFALFLGEDEIRDGKVTVKNMVSGEQTTDTVSAMVPMIREAIAAKKAEPIIVM
ncbi:MAG: histidine--tRNA ligase [Clostridia bacterium]|nr:histidine--tRNA ligase [Clostridia bacterium]